MEAFMLSIALIGFGVILLSLSIFAGFLLGLYYLIKRAVKNGVLEALEEYHSEENCKK